MTCDNSWKDDIDLEARLCSRSWAIDAQTHASDAVAWLELSDFASTIIALSVSDQALTLKVMDIYFDDFACYIEAKDARIYQRKSAGIGLLG